MVKSKFCDEITEALIVAHENGLPRKACAGLVGINRRTLYRWLKRGENAKSGKYKKFYSDWLKAEAKFQAYHMKKINDSKSWMASQYLLQVTDPETYVIAEKREVEAEVKSESDVKVTSEDLTNDEFMENELTFMKELINEDK